MYIVHVSISDILVLGKRSNALTHRRKVRVGIANASFRGLQVGYNELM